MKYYKRYLRKFDTNQILCTLDGNFYSIWNEPLGAHQTVGCCPNEFEEGKKIRRGFLSDFEFKRWNPPFEFFCCEENFPGNHTGTW